MEKLLEKYPEAKASVDLLQSLSVEIAKEELVFFDARARIYAETRDYDESSALVNKAYEKMMSVTAPMRAEREVILKHLTALQATLPLYMAVPA